MSSGAAGCDGVVMRLLCGIDHSTTSLAAACFAGGVARRLDAELTLVHVVGRTAPVPPPDAPAPPPSEPDATAPPAGAAVGPTARRALGAPGAAFGARGDDSPATAERMLRERVEALAELTGARASLRIEHGAPAATLRRVARETGCDLLVVGSSGRGRLAAALRPGVAQRLASAPPCPLALVPEEATGAAAERIVVGCHGAAASPAATAAAARLAALLDAELVLVPAVAGGRGRPTGWERYDAERRHRRAARAAVGRAVPVSPAARAGDPVATVARPTGDDDAWMVVGQRPRGPLAVRLRRPLAADLAAVARQPVVVVPDPGPAAG